MSKIRVGIIFGGKSTEHEVSLQSAKNVIEALDKSKFEPVLIGIDKTGRWQLTDSANYLLNADNPKLIKINHSNNPVTLIPDQSSTRLIQLDPNNLTVQQHKNLSVDVVFPVLHGPLGEDGTIQGLLKLFNVPFVGCSVLGSAIGMDKDVMKRLLRDAGIPIAKFLVLKQSDYLHSHPRSNRGSRNIMDSRLRGNDKETRMTFQATKKQLGLQIFIKPANAGSSVGVSKVETEQEFAKAVEKAFKYDTKILIEQGIKGREIEVSVLGNDDPKASLPGEVIPTKDFYSYDAKYIDEDGAKLQIPAELTKKQIDKIQTVALNAYKVLCCEGMARVDMFLTESGEVLVNEINTIPGFTKISMYPKLWEVSGLPYRELITRLIELAIDRHKKEQKLQTGH